MAAESKITTDPKEIRKWAEEREGRPAQIKGTGSDDDAGLLRINFPGGKEDSLEDITWEEFFEKFEEKQLALLYQDKTAEGKISRFSKIVSRENADSNKAKSSSKSRPAAKNDSKAKAASKPKAESKEQKETKPKAKSEAKPKPKAAAKPKAEAKTKAASKAKPKAKA